MKTVIALSLIVLGVSSAQAQTDQPLPETIPVPVPLVHLPMDPAPIVQKVGCTTCGVDLMDVRNFGLLDYRRMFRHGRTPTSAELCGTWRGVNKGIVRLVGFKQFIKEIRPCGSVMIGDNIEVHQVSNDLLRCCGWQPKIDSRTGGLARNGKYLVKPPNHRGFFGHGVIFNYREGGNRRFDPSRFIVDKVVVLDHSHLLGRATVRIGLIDIPVAYFVLERIG